MAGYKKPRVICPYCERDGAKNADGSPRHFTINGMTAHVRSQHTADYKDWQANKEKYTGTHGCDDNGALIKGGSPKEGSFPEPPESDPRPGDIEDGDEYDIEELDGDEPPAKPGKRKPESDPEPDKPGFFRRIALDLGFKDD